MLRSTIGPIVSHMIISWFGIPGTPLHEPDFIAFHLYLAESYALSGREAEARAAAAEVLKLNPKFTLRAYEGFVVYKNRSDMERDLMAFRKAGLPDGAQSFWRPRSSSAPRSVQLRARSRWTGRDLSSLPGSASVVGTSCAR